MHRSFEKKNLTYPISKALYRADNSCPYRHAACRHAPQGCNINVHGTDKLKPCNMIFISVINQLDAQNLCFIISLFLVSTYFEHMCSKYVETRNKLILTPWSRVPLEQLTGLQLVKKFPAFHGTRRFITALTSARHLSLSWASPIQSTCPHPTSWRSILIFNFVLLCIIV